MVGAAASQFSAGPHSAHSRVAQLVELEAALLARRAMQQPSSWFLDLLLAEQMKNRPMKLQLETKLPLAARPCSPDFAARGLAALKPFGEGVRILSKPSDADILCGRGGKSNHHVGNKRYRQVVAEMKASYRTIGSKSAKTDLSRAIVEHVQKYGGRFLKFDKESRKYIVLTQSEARKKTSQALREAKDVKWTK